MKRPDVERVPSYVMKRPDVENPLRDVLKTDVENPLRDVMKRPDVESPLRLYEGARCWLRGSISTRQTTSITPETRMSVCVSGSWKELLKDDLIASGPSRLLFLL